MAWSWARQGLPDKEKENGMIVRERKPPTEVPSLMRPVTVALLMFTLTTGALLAALGPLPPAHSRQVIAPPPPAPVVAVADPG